MPTACSTSTRRPAMWCVLVTLALVAAAFAATAPAVADDTTTPPHTLVFGAFSQPRSGQSNQQAVSQLEGQIGRKLETVRVYTSWETPFPDAYNNWLKAGGRTLMLSIRPRRANGTIITWRQIADAAPGSPIDNEMHGWAQKLKAFSVPIYVTLNHEPETAHDIPWGTNTDYIDAWRRWVTTFREVGATNVRHIWIMTDYAFMVGPTARNYGPDWYPGDDYVDAMATDSYNWYHCRINQDIPWWSLAFITEPFRKFGLLHPTKPLWLTEFGSAEDPADPTHKAAWFQDARALFATPAYSQFAGVVYFNWSSTTGSFAGCVWRVDSTPGSLAAYAGMAKDPLYSGTAPWDLVSGPNTAPVAAFTSTSNGHTAQLASTSTDPGGSVVGTSWDFGDGVSGSGTPVSHTYGAAGTYHVTLTVTDNQGATNAVTQDVTVVDPVVTPISFVGSAQSNLNATTHRVTVPAGVHTGDALVVAFTANTDATVSAPTGLSGWRLLGTQTRAGMSSRMWSLSAPVGAAGKTISVAVSTISKGNLALSAYRGTAADPVASVASATETVSRTTHTSPSVNVSNDRSWVVWYWAQKDSGTALLTPPASVQVRANGTSSPSGRIAGLLADSGAPTGTGLVAGRTVTAMIAKPDATMWSIVLAPQ